MKLNKFMVTTVLYFKSGTSKKVNWIEDRLVKKVKGDESVSTEPLDLEEADAFFVAKFKEWKDNGSTIVRKNVKGDNSIIPFSEVEYATLQVTVYEESDNTQGEVRQQDVPKSRSIESHPAFQKPVN